MRERQPTASERACIVDEHLAFADAALALAGHEVTDSELRNVRRSSSEPGSRVQAMLKCSGFDNTRV